jgi:hypothetical protein
MVSESFLEYTAAVVASEEDVQGSQYFDELVSVKLRQSGRVFLPL